MTPQGDKAPPLTKKQLSDLELRELIRPHVPELIQRLVTLATEADNDSVKVSAVKTLLAKVMPDLKADEISGEIKGKWIVELKQYGNNTSNKIDSNATT